MARLRQEILSVTGDSNHPSREQIQKLRYLRNVIRESPVVNTPPGLSTS